MKALKHLLAFIVLGGMLHVAEHLAAGTMAPAEKIIRLSSAELQQLRSQYQAQSGRNPTAAEFDQAVEHYIDGEILVNEAISLGIHREDPVVMRRIAMNLQFLEQEINSDSLLDQTLVTDMVRYDLVIRRRLIERMEKIIAQQYATSPTEVELQRYLHQHTHRYEQGPRYQVMHAFFPKHSLSSAEMALLYQRWKDGAINDGSLRAMAADAFVSQQQRLSKRSLSRIFGATLAEEIIALQPGQPLPLRETETGFHVFKLLKQHASAAPALAQIRARVEQDYGKSQQQNAKEAALNQLRRVYKIERAG